MGNESNEFQIPMVLIVVEGGENTIQTVAESVEKNIQVLLIKVCFY